MSAHDTMTALWLQTRGRLLAKDLLAGANATLSIRSPGSGAMWLGAATDAGPVRFETAAAAGDSAALHALMHALIYRARADVGAVAVGGGVFGACLADFGGRMPQVFDEQARHLGEMGQAARDDQACVAALRAGGNALLWHGVPVCLGTTCTRLALNAELFEKCAKAYVLAVAAGGRVRPLPWLVRWVANGRLAKDERRAALAFARGDFPVESRGY